MLFDPLGREQPEPGSVGAPGVLQQEGPLPCIKLLPHHAALVTYEIRLNIWRIETLTWVLPSRWWKISSLVLKI